MVVGTCPPGPWVKALAVQEALSLVTDEVVVVADADVWCDPAEAVQAVEDGAPWAIPHRMVKRLDEGSTAVVLAGGSLGGTFDQKPYVGHAGGGIVVLPTETLRDIPFDRRFVGWGQEDDSLACALTTLVGQPCRGEEDLWHLWHPPQERMNRIVGSQEGRDLAQRYRRARRKPKAMRALVEEGKCLSSCS